MDPVKPVKPVKQEKSVQPIEFEKIIVEDNEELNDFIIENEKSNIYNNLIIRNKSETKYRITKFEKTKIIGIRATQLESGINSLLDKEKLEKYNKNYNVLEIAEEEFKSGLIPVIIKRKYANDKNVYLQFNEQNFSNLDL